MRAAVAHRHAEALRGADADVGAELARRHEQRQGEQIGGDDGNAAACVDGIDDRPQVMHGAGHAGILQQRGESVGVAGGTGGAGDDGDAERRGARLHDFERLRQHVVGDEQAQRSRCSCGAADAQRQGHRLCGGGGLVEHRGAGDRHAR